MKLNKRAESCFEVLNNVLGDQEFLFGDRLVYSDKNVIQIECNLTFVMLL
jgi:hypothetical protein